jgi:hypothetical protein
MANMTPSGGNINSYIYLDLLFHLEQCKLAGNDYLEKLSGRCANEAAEVKAVKASASYRDSTGNRDCRPGYSACGHPYG